MESAIVFALVSVGFIIAGATPYIIGIIRGDVIPHPFSYGTWGVLAVVNFFILIESSAGWAIFPAGVQLGCMAVYIIGGIFRFKHISINWFDYVCLGLGVVTLIIWMTSTTTYAAIATILVETIALLPTIKKGWLRPESESLLSWTISAGYPLFLLLASSDYSFASMAFWAYLSIENAGFAIMLWYKRRTLSE